MDEMKSGGITRNKYFAKNSQPCPILSFQSTENYRVGNFLFLCCQDLKNCTQQSRTQIHRRKSNDSFFAHRLNYSRRTSAGVSIVIR